MQVHFISAALPPAVDGIGDYTSHLAQALAKGPDALRVTVWTGRRRSFEPIEGVTIGGAFDPEAPATAWDLARAISAEEPDWVVLQYNPFAFGRRGLNLALPGALTRLRQRSVRTRLAVMFHETFVPIISLKFAIMTTWQRLQFHQLMRCADVAMFSISPWADQFRRWYGKTPIAHLPVGSNVPRVQIHRDAARQRLAIADDEVVLGVFGTAHASRSFDLVKAAADAVQAAGLRVRVLYVGADGGRVRAALGDVPLIADGPLPGEEVSRRLAAVDVLLATYSDGVSTRRGAMMAGLQHGLAVLGTTGHHTDAELSAADGHAMTLVPARDRAAFARAALRLARDRAVRERLGRAAEALFRERYAWPMIGRQLRTILGGHSA